MERVLHSHATCAWHAVPYTLHYCFAHPCLLCRRSGVATWPARHLQSCSGSAAPSSSSPTGAAVCAAQITRRCARQLWWYRMLSGEPKPLSACVAAWSRSKCDSCLMQLPIQITVFAVTLMVPLEQCNQHKVVGVADLGLTEVHMAVAGCWGLVPVRRMPSTITRLYKTCHTCDIRGSSKMPGRLRRRLQGLYISLSPPPPALSQRIAPAPPAF